MKSPRILKIIKNENFTIDLAFRNGEVKRVDFTKILNTMAASIINELESISNSRRKYSAAAYDASEAGWKDVDISENGGNVSYNFTLARILAFERVNFYLSKNLLFQKRSYGLLELFLIFLPIDLIQKIVCEPT
jgi:hypothetical protein